MRKVLIFAALATATAIIAGTLYGVRGDSEQRKLIEGVAYTMWDDSARDWVGWADQISIVKVNSEEQLPISKQVESTGEGFVGRRIGATVEATLWARDSSSWTPDGTPTVSSTVSLKTTDGWWMKDGRLVPYRDVATHRAELGDRLLVAIFKSEGYGWTMMSAGVPLNSGVVAPPAAGERRPNVAVAGRSTAELARALSSARPLPEVAKHYMLAPDARMRAVWEDSRVGREGSGG